LKIGLVVPPRRLPSIMVGLVSSHVLKSTGRRIGRGIGRSLVRGPWLVSRSLKEFFFRQEFFLS
jgi:hypothetical protein